MKRILVILLIAFSAFFTQAQMKPVNEAVAPYYLSAGFRAGFLTAGTVKYFLLDRVAVEAIAGLRYWQGPHLSLLVEYHHPHVFHVDNLYIYYGGGISTGYGSRTALDKDGNRYSYYTGYMGTEGIFGIEYNFSDLIDFPVAASVDIKPGIDWLPTPYPSLGSGALSVRYIFR